MILDRDTNAKVKYLRHVMISRIHWPRELGQAR